MRFLKQNTATRVTVGPFMDSTDGVTPETALTVTNCKLTLMVDDGGVPTLVLDAAATASAGNNDMVHVTNDDAGFYDLELTAAQTNYVGRAILSITDAANHCPVFHEFMILPANVYDSWLGTDTLDVQVTGIGANVITATSIAADAITEAKIADNAIAAEHLAANAIDLATFAADVKTGSALKANVETITANAITATAIQDGAITNAKVADDVDVNVKTISADAITAAAIADGAIDFATFAADCKTGTGLKANVESVTANAIDATAIKAGAIDAATFAADVDAEIAAMVWNALSVGYQAVGSLGAAVANILDDTGLSGVVVAAASKTGYTLTATTGLGNQTANITGTVSGNATTAEIADVPTVAEFEARTLAAAAYATAANQVTIASYIDTEIGALTTAVADLPTNAELATAFATAWSTTTIAEDYPADNTAATPAELLYLILSAVSQFSISSTTLTTYKLDGTTTAATYTLDSATAPTQRLRAT